MERTIKRKIYDDLVETMTLYEETKSKTSQRSSSSKQCLPPGQRLEMVSRLDRHRRRNCEIGECVQSALRFAKKSIDIMHSYERSIASLEDEMRQSSGFNHRRSKTNKLRKPARYSTKSVQTDDQIVMQNLRARSPETIQISSEEEEEDLDFNEPQQFVIDESRLNEAGHQKQQDEKQETLPNR